MHHLTRQESLQLSQAHNAVEMSFTRGDPNSSNILSSIYENVQSIIVKNLKERKVLPKFSLINTSPHSPSEMAILALHNKFHFHFVCFLFLKIIGILLFLHLGGFHLDQSPHIYFCKNAMSPIPSSQAMVNWNHFYLRLRNSLLSYMIFSSQSPL